MLRYHARVCHPPCTLIYSASKKIFELWLFRVLLRYDYVTGHVTELSLQLLSPPVEVKDGVRLKFPAL